MAKDSSTYEHVSPDTVGNKRSILVSDKAGRANILTRMQELGMEDALESDQIDKLVAEIKRRETQGYAYEDADASFEMLVRRKVGDTAQFFDILSYRVMGELRFNAKGEKVNVSEATIKLVVGGEQVMTVAEGNGPVNALDFALRKALTPTYPKLRDMRLTDYKVRILTPGDGTKAVTRVLIESRNEKGDVWNTIGVSPNVIDASFMALFDSVTYLLMRANAQK